jgi:hypothetical protein
LINNTFYNDLTYFLFIVYELFEQNFDKWTSGNEFINRFIQETQLNNWSRKRILEWIPYNRLENIKYLDKGGFSTIYEAIWLDGPIIKYNKFKTKLIRNSNQKVAIKSLDKSSNLNDKFLNEVLINV